VRKKEFIRDVESSNTNIRRIKWPRSKLRSRQNKCIAQTKSGLGRKPGKPPEQSLKLTTYYTDYGASVPFQTSEALPEDQKGGLGRKLLTYR
jgi:hypothetical protein